MPSPDELERYVTVKDLARVMQLSPRTVRRWAQRLGMAPTVAGHACQRWTLQAARRFLHHWAKANQPPHPQPLYGRRD